MKFFKIFLFMMVCLAMTACKNANFFIANLPTYLSGHYDTHKDIAYGAEQWQKMDIYVPKDAQNAPVVTFFYGGGWYTGDKKDYAFVADTLTKHGFIVVIPNYVKYPQQKYPAFQHDAAQATYWINQYINSYRGNPNMMHLVGHSAGGHIGMMLLADKTYLAPYKLKPNVYKTFVGLSAPYHFEPKEKKYKAVFGDLQNYKSMQASHFIDGTEPPMLLVQGNHDDTVLDINIERLSKALDIHGNRYEIYRYDAGHADTIAGFTNIIGIKNKKLIAKIVHFLEKNN